MPRCVVSRCVQKGKHKFPTDLGMRRQWEAELKNITKTRSMKCSTRSRLCATHFRDLDLQRIDTTTGPPKHGNMKNMVIAWTKPKTVKELHNMYNITRKEMTPADATQQLFLKDIPTTCKLEASNKDNKQLFKIPGVPNEVKIPRVAPISPSAQHTDFSCTNSKSKDAKPATFYALLKNIGEFKIELSKLYLAPMADFMTSFEDS